MAAVAVSATISIGWLLQIRFLAAPLDASHPMKLNTALAVVALGSAGLFSGRSTKRTLRRRGVITIGAACLASGAFTLVQVLGSTNIGIDELLRADPWSTASVAPGRPAPQAVLAVMCIAVALLLPSRRARLREGLVVGALLLGTLGLVGHVFAVEQFVTVGAGYGLPVEASVVLLLLSVGVLFTTTSDGPILSLLVSQSVGGATLRRLLAPALVLPLWGAALQEWLYASGTVSVKAAIWSVGLTSAGLAVASTWLVARSTERLTLRAVAEQTRYEELFDSIPEGIYETAFDGTLLMANEPLAHLLGYPTVSELRRRIRRVDELWIDPGERENLIRRINAGQSTGTLEVLLRRLDGAEITIELSYRTVTDHTGTPTGLRGTVRDVTAAVAAHQQLDEAQEQYQLAFENGPLGRFVLDVTTPATSFLQVNRALAGLLGHTVATLSALDPLELLHPDDLDAEAAQMAQLTAIGGGSVSYGTRRRHKTGGWIPVWLTGALLRDRIGNPRYAMATIEDRRPSLAAEAETVRAWHETLLRLAKAVEYRDEETGGHVDRMSAYCELIALHSGLDPDLAASVRTAAQLHDAGKIAIPDHILLKPGRLTAEERQVMETHSDIGHELLAASENEALDLAATIAWTHHERYDGCGYPRRLAGTNIPLEGRIAAVADVFDALTSDRIYRKALPLNDALAIMRDGRKTQFDPDILDTFLDHLDEALVIQATYRDETPPNAQPFSTTRWRYTSAPSHADTQ